MVFGFFKRPTSKRTPSDGAMQEAKLNPGGWVYEIDGDFGDDEDIPPQTIIGGWKVNDHGEIIGDFIENPNYRKKGPN